jgi:hypothetical protein
MLRSPTRSSALDYTALFRFPHKPHCCVEASSLPQQPTMNRKPSLCALPSRLVENTSFSFPFTVKLEGG